MKCLYDFPLKFWKYKTIKGNSILSLLIVLLPSFLTSQTSYTFSNCGATGRIGPTSSQVSTAYIGTNLSGLVSTTSPTSGIQTFTVPPGVSNIRVEAWGAEGGAVGANAGGKGARMRGDFTVTPGQVLNIVVGQQGLPQATNNCNGGGGGGGSFVYINGAPQPLIAAGGGGGGHLYLGAGMDGTTSTAASTSTNSNGSPGSSGSGGGAGVCGSGWPGAGGAGWSGAGANSCVWAGDITHGGATQFTWLGGLRNQTTNQGTQGQDGSFGGGGAAFHGAGGGGGYSGGGGGGSCFANEQPLGGGGGSYNGGNNQFNSPGVRSGHGAIIITTFSNTPISVIINQTGNISCNGYSNGALTASASGGQAPYSFAWLPGSGTGSVLSNIPAGVFTVIVTDANSNSVSATYNLTQPPAVTMNVASTNVSCNGNNNGSATITASGGTSPYNYSWFPASGNNSVTSTLAAGNHTAVVTDANGCSKSASFAIIQTSSVGISGGGTVCTGQSATLSAYGAPSFTWSTGAVSSSIVVTPTASAVYSVSAANCPNGNTVSVVVSPCTGLPLFAVEVSHVKVYPNPSGGEFTVENACREDAEISVYDFTGKMVIRPGPLGTAAKINLQSYAKGIYFLKVSCKEKSEVVKVLLE